MDSCHIGKEDYVVQKKKSSCPTVSYWFAIKFSFSSLAVWAKCMIRVTDLKNKNKRVIRKEKYKQILKGIFSLQMLCAQKSRQDEPLQGYGTGMSLKKCK